MHRNYNHRDIIRCPGRHFFVNCLGYVRQREDGDYCLNCQRMRETIWNSLSNPWRTSARPPRTESPSLSDVLHDRLQRLSLNRDDERVPQPAQPSVQCTQETQGTQGPVLNGCHIERFYNTPNGDGLHATPIPPTPTVARESEAERMHEEPHTSPQHNLPEHEQPAQPPTPGGRAPSPRPPNRDIHFIYDVSPRSTTPSRPPTRVGPQPTVQSGVPTSVASSGLIPPAERPLYNSDASIVADPNSGSNQHENNTSAVGTAGPEIRLHNPFSREFRTDGAFTRHFRSNIVPARNRGARNGVAERRAFRTWSSGSSTVVDLPSLNGPSRRRGQVDDDEENGVTEATRSASGGALVAGMPAAADDEPRCNGVSPGTFH